MVDVLKEAVVAALIFLMVFFVALSFLL